MACDVGYVIVYPSGDWKIGSGRLSNLPQPHSCSSVLTQASDCRADRAMATPASESEPHIHSW